MNTWMGVIGGATGHRRHHVKIRRIRRRQRDARERRTREGSGSEDGQDAHPQRGPQRSAIAPVGTAMCVCLLWWRTQRGTTETDKKSEVVRS